MGILKNSQVDSQNILDGVAGRLAKARKEQEAYYLEKTELFKRNAEAAIPLEKERFLVTYENSAIVDSINDYLQSLSAEKKLELIEKLLQKYSVVLAKKKINAYVAGFDIKTIKKLLENVLGKDSILAVENASSNEIDFEGCIIETDDKAIKCRLTISELIDEIVDTKRLELATTLFGGRLPQ